MNQIPELRSRISKLKQAIQAGLFVGVFSIIPLISFGQDQGTEGGGQSLTLLLFVACMVILAFVLILMSDRILQLSAEKALGSKGDKSKYRLIPNFKPYFKDEEHPVAGRQEVIQLDKGMDVKVSGKIKKYEMQAYHGATYAVKPIDYKGLRPIPKMLVEVGAEVKAGDAVFYDKNYPTVKFTAPVSGEVAEIRRGAKRAINEVVILADKEIKYKDFGAKDATEMSKADLIELMLDSGTWTSLVERPYGVVADPEASPKSIFISCFDTSPLALDLDQCLIGDLKEFQTGIDALQKLTVGEIHLGLSTRKTPNKIFTSVSGVERHWFDGIHPAGNVGVQIHHIDPVNKGEKVWTIKPQDVMTLGRLLLTGKYSPVKAVGVVGPMVETPTIYATLDGACVDKMIEGKLSDKKTRLISGNVLTGMSIENTGFVGHWDNVITAIEEGDFYEFMGWLLPSYPRPSRSVTFPWKMFPFAEFDVNTNTHGEKRAFVVTGEYESVLPMDVYPVHLLKAILANDFEKIEGLGIYELLEEDIALCEFVCTSKQPAQQILRQGLDYIREQS